MNRTKYELLSNLPKFIFSFIASYIICAAIFGVGFLFNYCLIVMTTINPLYVFSSEVFLIYINIAKMFIIQSTIYSIIMCIIDIWMLEDDYEKTHYIRNGEKIERTLFFKLKLLKHIPIFSIFNAICYLCSGKNFLNRIYKIDYDFKNKNPEFDRALKNWFRIIVIFLVVQIVGCGYMYFNDKEVKMADNLKELETIKDVSHLIMVDSNENNVYNLIITLEDAYIHHNRMEYTEKTIKEELKNCSEFIIKKYEKRIGEIDNFNIIMYNDYTKTWDKNFYNQDFSVEYEMKSISDNIADIDIYIKNGTLVYNILTNLSKNEIGWDMAEFILNEFTEDIESETIQENIKNIVSYDGEINKYVVNILSKEYYSSKNNTYFVYIKNKDEIDWYYYDNQFYTLEKQEENFEYEILKVFKNVSLDFSNLYDLGEIYIISKEDIDIDSFYDILNNTEYGVILKKQVEYIGKIAEIKFIKEE